MKKLSSRLMAVLTNCALSLILVAVAAVCFLPSASSAAGIDDNAVRKGNSPDGVSLMINVYWGTDEVYRMLDVLSAHGAVATFFLGGCWADDNVSCVREILARGHEIGSHGYFHLAHDTLSEEENLREISASVEFLSLVTGRPTTLFAPPSGAYAEGTLKACERLGLKCILWSKDTVDWRDSDGELVFRRATEGVEGGDLILMHPMPHTADVLGRILEAYAEKGLRTVTVSENSG